MIIIAAIFTVLFITELFVRWHFSNEATKVMETALAYLAANYEQEMVFESFFYLFPEVRYTLTFSKKEDPSFLFRLDISKNMETSEYMVTRDDFFDKLIKNELRNKYYPIIYAIWGNVEFSIHANTTFMNAHSYLNEFSTIDDIYSGHLHNKFFIFISLPSNVKKNEANNIFRLIESMQEDEFMPRDISVAWQLDEEDLITVEHSVCWIYQVEKITNIEQVYHAMSPNPS